MALKKALTRAGLVVAGVVASLAIASPAMAADVVWHTNDGDPGGEAQWTSYGDVVTVCDIEADGWAASVQVYLKQSDGTYKFRYQAYAGGNGSCVSHNANQGGVYNLPEGTPVKIKLCLMQNNWDTLAYCDSMVFSN